MFTWFGFNGTVLTLFGSGFLATLLLAYKKNRVLKNFDYNSTHFISDLFSALNLMKTAEIDLLCHKESSPLAHLAQDLLKSRDRDTQLARFQQHVKRHQNTLAHHLNWLLALTWIAPFFALFACIVEIATIFIHTEIVFKQLESGPEVIAFHLLIAFIYMIAGLSLSLWCFFLRQHFKHKNQLLIAEFEKSGQEILAVFEELNPY